MEKKKIQDVCIVNPHLDVKMSGDMKVSFLPMTAVSTDGRIDLTKTLESEKIKNYSVFQNGDVLIAKITPCMENGKGAIADNLLNGYGAGSTEFIVLRPKSDIISSKWLFLYLSQQSFRQECKQHMTGSAGQKRVQPKYLASCTVPVPPLPEQKRIVARIEELFSELDKAVETLNTTKQQLAVYRQAVLKDVFDRAGDNVVALKQIVEKPRYGTSKKCSYDMDENSVAVYRIPNINFLQGKISHDDLKYATFLQDEYDSLRLRTGDILIIRSNGSVSLVGRSAVVSEEDTHGLFAGYLMRLRIKEGVEVLPHYLNLYLNTHYARHQIEQMAKSTSGVNNINSDEICRINLPVCKIDLQEEIIQEIESRLSVCDSIEKTVDTALQQAEAMRQSILKQAFEGRL